jgi:cytochrome b involved in lipid metabolism
MKSLFTASTVGFVLALAAFWGASVLVPSHRPLVSAAERSYTMAQVAKHDRPQDCWMVIAGSVYDFSSYLPQHPSDPKIVAPWCGKEATEAYRTKTKGRPHSPYADQLLTKYRIGKVQ